MDRRIGVMLRSAQELERHADEMLKTQEEDSVVEAERSYSSALLVLTQVGLVGYGRDTAHLIPHLLAKRSVALHWLGSFAEALSAADEALALCGGDFAAGHLHRGRALLGLGRMVEAKLAYSAAHALQPGSAWLQAQIETLDEAVRPRHRTLSDASGAADDDDDEAAAAAAAAAAARANWKSSPGDYLAWALSVALLAEGHVLLDLVPGKSEGDPVLERARPDPPPPAARTLAPRSEQRRRGRRGA